MNNEKIKRQFDIVAKEYDNGRRYFIPCFDDYYIRSVSLLKTIKPTIKNVADLGAGTGLLSKQLFELFPTAHYTLIDLSASMLDIARKRFDGISNFEYLVNDYSNGLSEGFDCICSALSIHHLKNEDKQKLYKKIYDVLPIGGCFLTLDQFCADNPIIDKAYTDWWLNYIDNSGISNEDKAKWMERKKLDKEVSVSFTETALRKAGFSQVECVYQFMKFATIIAVK